MAVASSPSALLIQGSLQKPSTTVSDGGFAPPHLKTTSPPLKHSKTTIWKGLPELPPLQGYIVKAVENTTRKVLDSFVDSVFRFVDQPLLPSQRNFGPVEEIGEEAQVYCSHGQIPRDFPQGVFIRNGPNPLFGGLKSTESIFGRSSDTWVEGEGMLHALYFNKSSPSSSDWTLSYKNRYVESETFKLEKQRNKPGFLPAVEGDSCAILAAYFLNFLRFGAINKYMNNTNVLKHSGKIYTIAENYVPQEVDIHTLETYGVWDFNGAWDQPFTSHPKKAPRSGELVIMGFDAKKPYFLVGVISADGKKLVHKADLGLDRSTLSHEIGVTDNCNVIMDHPLLFDLKRLLKGGPLLKFDKGGYARIGVMPRYGDVSSVRWFDVEPNCTFHIFNCYEHGNEVIVRGCRALTAIFPGPDWGTDNKFGWFTSGFDFTNPPDAHAADGSSNHKGYLFARAYEWRLNMVTGGVEETNLSGTDFSMDFPFINESFTGLKNRFGYAQVIDSKASSVSGMAKFGGLAKLYFDEPSLSKQSETESTEQQLVKVEYHHFEANTFCTGSVFVPKINGGSSAEEAEESGWIVTYVHNEESETSQVYIIDAEKFEAEPVAKITLPQRVPYGFHGTFVQF